MVYSSIIREVKESECFIIMVNEVKYVSKKEQMLMVLRYYCRGPVCESLLHFEAAQHLDAAALTEKIIQKLQHYGCSDEAVSLEPSAALLCLRTGLTSISQSQASDTA